MIAELEVGHLGPLALEQRQLIQRIVAMCLEAQRIEAGRCLRHTPSRTFRFDRAHPLGARGTRRYTCAC